SQKENEPKRTGGHMRLSCGPGLRGGLLVGSALAALGAPVGGIPAAAVFHSAARPATVAMLLGGSGDARQRSTLRLLLPSRAGRGGLAPEPGKASALTGVYCTSSASCWAVGTYEPTTSVWCVREESGRHLQPSPPLGRQEVVQLPRPAAWG